MIAAITVSLLGVRMQLASPERWWWLAAAAIGAGLLAWGAVQGGLALRRLSDSAALRATIAPGASRLRWALGRGATVLALFLLALAALRPQLGEREVLVQQRGIDVVVAVDASHSMLARDIRPSRLERAKLELSSLIDDLGGDRVGLVAFAGEAFVQCPLTYDQGAAKLFLRAIDPESMPSQGTAVARAIEVAKEMLEAAEDGAKTQVILLLSDGEDHSGSVDAAIRAVSEAGIRVFALGVGTEAGSPIPIVNRDGAVLGYKQDRQGNTVVSKLNDAQLRHVADRTGGIYVSAAGGDLGMDRIRAALASLEQTEREGHLATEWEEAYHLFAFPGLLLLLVGGLIPERRRR